MPPSETIRELRIEKIVPGGKGLARCEGKVVFVEGAIAGDVVDVEILRSKKDYLEGRAKRLIEPSHKRIPPFCSHFGVCGGCQWQQMRYEDQLQLKEEFVSEAFGRGDFSLPEILPILPSGCERYFRNKLEFSFSAQPNEEKVLGFHATGDWNSIIDIGHCFLQRDPSNAIRLAAREIAIQQGLSFFNREKREGFLRTLLIRTAGDGRVGVCQENSQICTNSDSAPLMRLFPNSPPSMGGRSPVGAPGTQGEGEFEQPLSLTLSHKGRGKTGIKDRLLDTGLVGSDETMVIVSFFQDEPVSRTKFLKSLAATFPQVVSWIYVINETDSDKIEGLPIRLFKGRDYLLQEIEGVRFKISAQSFFQTNTLAAAELYRVVQAFARPAPDQKIFDLYTGSGAIALLMARSCREVIGIDRSRSAIRDASFSATLNGLSNAKFFSGEMRKVFTPAWAGRIGKPDSIITNPGRAGMEPEVIQTILSTQPGRIVYVSCNAPTQARDIGRILSAEPTYQISAIQPVDLFPHSAHVENVVLLIPGKGG